MDQGEYMQRVVGILTQALEWAHQKENDEHHQGSDEEYQLIGEMLSMPFSLEIPANAPLQMVIDLVTKKIHESTTGLTTAFIAAFVQLAYYHDTGQTDVSSTDVLRELALRAEEPDVESD